jgi:integrase/recombinase XerD
MLTQTKTQTSMSQLQRFTWTEPVLCHYNYDLKRTWFVYFDFTDRLTLQTLRRQYRADLHKYKTKSSRLSRAKELIQLWRNRLSNGYNPLLKDEVHKMPYNYKVSEAFNRVLSLHLPSLKKRAKETYTYVVKKFVEWVQANRYDTYMKDFAQASEYMDYLITVCKYSGRTHNDHLIILKVLINCMIEREWILKNPFKKVKPKETTIGRNLAYTDEERETLKKLLYEKDRDMYYLSQIMYYCFIRRSELAGLKIGDIDLSNHTITIPADVSKNKTQESVVIPVGLEPILKEMDLGKYSKDDYIFGYRLQRCAVPYKNINHISTRHNKFLKKLKIDSEKGLYSWKHSGVCVAYYATGKDIYSVMRQLRHRDLNTTQIYLKSLGLTSNDVFRNAMVA